MDYNVIMISYVEGVVLHADENKVLVKTTAGVGYELYYRGVSRVGASLELYTAHIIREQSQELFAFKSMVERELFYMLVSVNGVGPKSSYSLVTTIGVEGVKKAIIFEEKKTLTQAPGIGPKAAAQMILSLKDKIAGMGAIDLAGAGAHLDPTSGRVLDEVLQACNELGFKEADILPLVRVWLKDDPEADAQSLVKKVLIERRF